MPNRAGRSVREPQASEGVYRVGYRSGDGVRSLPQAPLLIYLYLLKPSPSSQRGVQQIMSSAKHIYSIADNHAQTVQVCIDRLHELGANEQLKRLTGRLQELAVRATPGDDDKDTKAAPRERGQSQGRNQQRGLADLRRSQ